MKEKSPMPCFVSVTLGLGSVAFCIAAIALFLLAGNLENLPGGEDEIITALRTAGNTLAVVTAVFSAAGIAFGIAGVAGKRPARRNAITGIISSAAAVLVPLGLLGLMMFV